MANPYFCFCNSELLVCINIISNGTHLSFSNAGILFDQQPGHVEEAAFRDEEGLESEHAL